jgi:hypothetical protein
MRKTKKGPLQKVERAFFSFIKERTAFLSLLTPTLRTALHFSPETLPRLQVLLLLLKLSPSSEN